MKACGQAPTPDRKPSACRQREHAGREPCGVGPSRSTRAQSARRISPCARQLHDPVFSATHPSATSISLRRTPSESMVRSSDTLSCSISHARPSRNPPKSSGAEILPSCLSRTATGDCGRYPRRSRFRTPRPRPGCSSRRKLSPMSQNIGGQSPTKSARRSAFPRSSSPTVLARIHRPMQSAIEPSDVA